MKSIASFILIILFNGSVLAGGYTGDLEIDYVTTYGNSHAILVKTTDSSNQTGNYVDGCANNYWVLDSDDDVRRNRMYSGLMTALIAGKKVNFYYQDSCGLSNYHVAAVVRVHK